MMCELPFDPEPPKQAPTFGSFEALWPAATLAIHKHTGARFALGKFGSAQAHSPAENRQQGEKLDQDRGGESQQAFDGGTIFGRRCIEIGLAVPRRRRKGETPNQIRGQSGSKDAVSYNPFPGTGLASCAVTFFPLLCLHEPGKLTECA